MAAMTRPLPSMREAAAILASRRTRPPPRPPLAAGRAASRALKSLEDRFGKGSDGLAARWREIVGPNLSRRSEPVRVVKARSGPAALEIRVDGPSAALIQHQAADILARVNLFLGPDAVGRLRIVQGPLRRPETSARPPVRACGGAVGPLDAAAEKRLAASLADLPEGRMKTALMGLGREVLRRR
jgi:hypothetical protein